MKQMPKFLLMYAALWLFIACGGTSNNDQNTAGSSDYDVEENFNETDIPNDEDPAFNLDEPDGEPEDFKDPEEKEKEE